MERSGQAGGWRRYRPIAALWLAAFLSFAGCVVAMRWTPVRDAAATGAIVACGLVVAVSGYATVRLLRDIWMATRDPAD